MKWVKIALVLALSMTAVGLSHQITTSARQNQQRQHDHAEISDIKYGLFSINQWKQKISEIISKEVARLDLDNTDRAQIKPVVEKQLETLIDAVHKKVQASNQESLKGKVKQAFIDTFVDLDEIKEGIPAYADEMIKVLETPRTKNEIKGIILDKVGDYFARTFEKQDLSRIGEIVTRMEAANQADAKNKLEAQIAAEEKTLKRLMWALIAVSSLVFVLAATSRNKLHSTEYFAMIFVLLALLVVGVATPMINLEAKITEMSFVLLDHPVQFLDQVLYFQSKSVLDVFWIMIAHHELQMKIVGILMVAFSVIFPLLKLVSSIVFHYEIGRLQRNPVVRFFVLKSGKWSMTDVLIIAIFMAFIGFNGIISSQFGKLHSADNEVVLLTTNGTSLQPGFYLFFTYAVLALFLTEIIARPRVAKGEK